ncbi:MAG: sulfotransferase [Pseudomonadota bacterium]
MQSKSQHFGNQPRARERQTGTLEAAVLAKLSVQKAILQAEAHARKGELSAARGCYDQVLAAFPKNRRAKAGRDALSRAADAPRETLEAVGALFRAGQFTRTVEAVRRALTTHPGSAGLWRLLGAAAAELNDHATAEQAFKEVRDLLPDRAESHANLGAALTRAGRHAEAVSAFEAALARGPRQADTHVNLARALFALKRYSDAVSALETALAHRPDALDTLRFLGIARLAANDAAGAVAAHEAALRHAPDHWETHLNLGQALHHLKHLPGAIAAFRRALELKPGSDLALTHLGTALLDTGDVAAAATTFEGLIGVTPDDPLAHNNLGVARQLMGDLSGAEAAFARALSLAPGAARTYKNLASVKRWSPDDPLIPAMEALATDPGLSDEERVHFAFALFRAHDTCGALERAFHWLSLGNRLRKAAAGHRTEVDAALFAAVRDAAQSLPDVLPSGREPTCPRPIFIVGLPRSGTTLVEQILSAHPDVQGAGELDFVHGFGGALATGRASVGGEALAQFRARYLGALKPRAGRAGTVTDKMPHNFRYLALIAHALPEAGIVHVHRDPGATCWSNYAHDFNGEGLDYTHDPEQIASFHRLYLALMQHWERRLPGRIHHVDYERLTTEQEPVTRSLLSALNLCWDPACLAPEGNARAVGTASATQVRQPVYQGSSRKWLRYRPFLGDVFDGLDAFTPTRP